MSPEHWSFIVEKPKQGWSSERISGRLRMEGLPTAGREWTYRRIRADSKPGGDLYLHLRRRGKKPKWKEGRRPGTRAAPANRTDISERPPVKEEKFRAGDREADTIVGAKHRGAVVSEAGSATKHADSRSDGRKDIERGRSRTEGATWQSGHAGAYDHLGQRQGVRRACRRGAGARNGALRNGSWKIPLHRLINVSFDA